jgi:hypothetical protein
MSSRLTLHKADYLPHQWDFMTINARHPEKKINAMVGGYGCGKTWVFIRKCAYNLIMKKNADGISNGWVIYPTYDLAEELFVQPMKELLENNGIHYEYNVQKHRFTTVYGNMKIYQMQKSQNIVGSSLSWIGFDEFDVGSYKQTDLAYKKAIGRMRGSDDCEIFIVTSPEGFGKTYEVFVNDFNDSKSIVHGKTTDNFHLPEAYVKLLEDNYDETMLKAYRDGQFVNISALSTYHSFDRSKNVQKCEYDRSQPVRVGLDFNNDPMCAILFNIQPDKPEVRVFDEISLSHQGAGDLLTSRMAQLIKHKYPNSQYIVYPDASGFQRHTSAMLSDIDLLRQAGFTIKVRKTNPPVTNRVNSVNKMLEGNCIIDPSCKMLIQDLEQVTNKQGTREIDKSNKMLTHMSDALGYAIEWEFPIIKPTLGAIER